MMFDLPEGATVGQLRAALIERHPTLKALVRHCVFAVGTEYASDATAIVSGQEVACIPPVSGG